MREPIPLSERRIDLVPIGFFIVNLLFTVYIVDLEPIVIADPARFSYPPWPPRALVDLVHWYGRTADALFMARPVWYRTHMVLQAAVFGPFYVAATLAFVKGKEWIRVPSLLWGASLLTCAITATAEQIAGPHPSPRLATVMALYLPWLLVPALVIARMWRSDHPFTRSPHGAPAGEAGERAAALHGGGETAEG